MGTLAEQAVESIHEVFGRHAGCRAAHATGVVCRGTFTATPDAAGLTRAEHMQGHPVQATVRFSNASGDPSAWDFANPCGMATKFALAGSETDIVAVTLKRFLVPKPETFIALNHAFKRNPKKKGAPGLGPRAIGFLLLRPRLWGPIWAASQLKPPESYATARYHALHAFKWIDPAGDERFVRYSWVPEAGEQLIDKKLAKRRPPDYLRREIAERLSREESIGFRLEVQIAAERDRPNDSTARWRGDRSPVPVGRLELTRLEGEAEGRGKTLVFDPTRLTEGIECSDDPILHVRPSAYAVSVRRRSAKPGPWRERAGRAGALTVITPIPLYWRLWLSLWWVVRLRIRFRHPDTNIRGLVDLSFISFAHWSTFKISTRGPNRRAQRYILFETNFFGDTEAYIEAFSYIVPGGVRSLWSGGSWWGAHGVPDPQPFTPFYRYVSEKRTPVAHYFSAYPDASTTMVVSALELKAQLDCLRHANGRPFEDRWQTFLCAATGALRPGRLPTLLGRDRSLSVLTPVLGGHVESLEKRLAALPWGEDGRMSPLSRVEGTHFARWAVVPYFEYRDETPLDSTSYLLFTSWFDGTFCEYAKKVATAIPSEADAIWSHCAGYPGALEPDAFRRYVLDHRIKPGLPFAAYPDATVAEVKDCLELRERLAEFAVDAGSLKGSELELEFHRRFPESG